MVIAFQRWHQSLVNSWFPLAEHLEETNPTCVCYEFTAIRRLNPLFRSFIDHGMRAGIPEQTARHETITLHTNKVPFKEVLEICGEETIYRRLVDPSGTVHWAQSGPVTNEAADDWRNGWRPWRTGAEHEHRFNPPSRPVAPGRPRHLLGASSGPRP